MNTAISLDTAGVKWPFAPQPLPQGRASRPAAPRPGRAPLSGIPVPALTPAVAPTAPSSTVPGSIAVPAPAPTPEQGLAPVSAWPAGVTTVTPSTAPDRPVPGSVAQPAAASMGISGVYADNLARAKPARQARVREIGSGMFVHQAQTVGAMRRQMVGDVVLVAAWAVMIPAVLWLGHAAGF